jgi:hypothetical protein
MNLVFILSVETVNKRNMSAALFMLLQMNAMHFSVVWQSHENRVYDSFRKWMMSLLSAFLPDHPFGSKWNNNPVSKTQTCENNGQGEWNFPVLKISQRKGNRTGHEWTYNLSNHPVWYSCVTFQWRPKQPKDFGDKNWPSE